MLSFRRGCSICSIFNFTVNCSIFNSYIYAASVSICWPVVGIKSMLTICSVYDSPPFKNSITIIVREDILRIWRTIKGDFVQGKIAIILNKNFCRISSGNNCAISYCNTSSFEELKTISFRTS